MKKAVAIYATVSTDRQTVDMQIHKFKEYINGLPITVPWVTFIMTQFVVHKKVELFVGKPCAYLH